MDGASRTELEEGENKVAGVFEALLFLVEYFAGVDGGAKANRIHVDDEEGGGVHDIDDDSFEL